jgi:hypothetical protein
MERWCLARAQKALPTRIVILTPTCVFGPGGGAYTSQPVELARNRQFCWIDGGTGLCNYTYVENLVDAMLAAARLPEAHGNRFIINDGHVSWREFLGPLVGADQQFPCLTMAELQALNQDASAFKLHELLEATISAPQVRAVARRSGVIRGLAKLMKIETSGAGVGRASNLVPVQANRGCGAATGVACRAVQPVENGVFVAESQRCTKVAAARRSDQRAQCDRALA